MLEQYGDFGDAITSSIHFPWKLFSTLLPILTSLIIILCNYGIALKVCIRETFLYDSKVWSATAKDTRGYFKMIKRLGIRQFVKKSPFWKKNFFLLWKVSKTTSNEGAFDLHLLFLITQEPFCERKLPFFETRSPFPRKISSLNKWSRNFLYFLFEMFLTDKFVL